MFIVGTNEFGNIECNTFVVGICVSVLRKSKFKSLPVVTCWLLERLLACFLTPCYEISQTEQIKCLTEAKG